MINSDYENTLSDISNELTIQKTYYEELFNLAIEGLVLLTREDRIVYFNDTFSELFGYSLEEAKGKYINELIAQGDKMEEANRISKNTLESKKIVVETIRYHKDGRSIPVEITTNSIVKDKQVFGIYALYKDLTQESKLKKELEIQSQYFNILFESSMDARAFLDLDQKVLNINTAFTNLFGYGLKECKGVDIDKLIVSKEYLQEAKNLLKRSLSEKPSSKETKRMKKGGEVFDVHASGHSIKVDDKLIGILVNYRDISQQKQILNALDEQREYFKQLFDNSPEAIVIIDTKDKVVDVNKGFCKIFGYEKNETIGKYINNLIVPDSILPEAESLSSKLIGGGIVKYESKRKSKTGQLIDVNILAYPIKLKNKNVGGYAIYSDITEKKHAQREIEFLAYRDSLTGLFNRGVFYDKLREKIKHMEKDQKLAVCYIDINGFKKVNDNMGHNIGDELLRYVANKIEDSVDKEDTVARMGGDEFAVFTDFIDYNEIDNKMKTIIEKLNIDLKIFDHNIKISLSIGIAIYPDHGKDVDDIIKKADTAMYGVKKDGRSGYLIYTSKMQLNDRYLYKVESGLKKALANNEIEMHYQPILSIDGKIKGFEALMRWESTSLGRITPGVFIPLAENNGEIHQLGIYALNESLRVFSKWQKRFKENLFMSINISVKQIEKDNFVDLISEILKGHKITGEFIHLEITESCSTENVPNFREKLSRLKEMGFMIAIDDFGTGFSSFGQLRDSYVDYIKIDRSFVDEIDKRTGNRAIVKAIVVLGKSIGAKIIAEGVETKEELKTMDLLGCDMYQGFLASKAADEKTIENFIESRT